ncbi:MAG: hypothetical protein OXE78_00780 [Gammaproteobacteria bacterium]|nr:hypothetical protein [Gammaproteobacteria bacterium]MCY4357165.1 hypothetical protein [Gammaproteobacteria bacterium]
MRSGFPERPDCGFSWRNLLIEPVSFSGERISLAAILKMDDGALVVPKLVSRKKLRSLFGEKDGSVLSDTLKLCIECAEDYYRKNPIFSNWSPPMQNFYLGDPEHSVALDLEEAVHVAGMHCSSVYSTQHSAEVSAKSQNNASYSRQWELKVKENVSQENMSYQNYFWSRIRLKEGGVMVKVGFVHEKYAAQFEAISSSSAIQNTMMRAQAKLWQLDLLRDHNNLFKIEECELLLGIPHTYDNSRDSAIQEFVEELEFEASRRELSVLTVTTPAAAASHIIEKAAA